MAWNNAAREATILAAARFPACVTVDVARTNVTTVAARFHGVASVAAYSVCLVAKLVDA